MTHYLLKHRTWKHVNGSTCYSARTITTKTNVSEVRMKVIIADGKATKSEAIRISKLFNVPLDDLFRRVSVLPLNGSTFSVGDRVVAISPTCLSGIADTLKLKP